MRRKISMCLPRQCGGEDTTRDTQHMLIFLLPFLHIIQDKYKWIHRWIGRIINLWAFFVAITGASMCVLVCVCMAVGFLKNGGCTPSLRHSLS